MSSSCLRIASWPSLLEGGLSTGADVEVWGSYRARGGGGGILLVGWPDGVEGSERVAFSSLLLTPTLTSLGSEPLLRLRWMASGISQV